MEKFLKPTTKFGIKFGLVLAIFTLMPLFSALAATIEVSGSCTLYKAIQNANQGNGNQSECTAGDSGADTINLTGNVTLTQLLPGLNTEITIDGMGYSVSGNDIYRIFNISDANSNITLQNLVLRDGRRTGSGGDGAAILVDNASAQLIIEKSVFIDNECRGAGCYGGGIYVNAAAATSIANTTFSGNRAASSGGSAIHYVAGTHGLRHVTIANGTSHASAGLFIGSGATVTMYNSLLADNESTNDCSGTLASGSAGNLIVNSNCGTPSVTTDPGLNALAGGVFTFASSSSAADAAACLTGAIAVSDDQLGTTRPQDGNGDGSGTNECDIGAWELPQTAVINVDVADDNTTDDSDCTLREAIINANDGAETHDDCEAGSTVNMIVVGSGRSITLSSALPDITANIIINGGGSTIDGASSYRILNVTGSSNLTLNSVILQNANQSSGSGGAIKWNSSGTLTVSKSALISNSADNNGGGIDFVQGTGVIRNSTFSANSAGSGGMAIHIRAGTVGIGFVTIANSTGSSATAALNIVSGAAVLLGNSILYGNAVADCSGTLLTGSVGNMIESNSCTGNSGDVSGDPDLQTLSGGIHRLGANSPAIDAVACIQNINQDQLGTARPQDGNGDGSGTNECDVGAYEALLASGTITVDSAGDARDNSDGVCTLREAISNAVNASRLNANCGAGGAVSTTITMNAAYNITLGSALGDISATITINGSGSTIDGGSAYRIFNLNSAASDLTLNGIVLQNGSASGNGGAVTVTAGGELTVTNSLFVGNAAARGGGINVSDGTVTITNSTFSGNSSTNGGSAINIGASGTATLKHVTIANNSGGRAGLLIFSGATATVTNTLMADNVRSGALYDCDGALESASTGNLIETRSCTGDATNRVFGDAKLLSLRRGIHPFASDSPALDAVACLNDVTDDQVGNARPTDGNGDGSGTNECDVGAWEAPQNVMINVDVADDNTTDDNNCSLREAIINANDGAETHDDCEAGGAGGNTIVVGSGRSITLGSALPDITANIAINGGGSTISGGATYQIFIVTTYGDLMLNDITLRNASGSGVNGGAVLVDSAGSSLTITGSTFERNSPGGAGGAIRFEGSELTITGSTFERNTASGGVGGAISLANGGGSATISKSAFLTNTATASGGAIHSDGYDLTIVNSTFSGNVSNHASGSGGAGLHLNGGTHSLTYVTIASNDGGAAGMVIAGSAAVTMTNSLLADNENADCNGTALAGNTGNLIVVNGLTSCGTPAVSTDPMLNALNRDGVHTFSRTSSAVDAVDCLSAVTDDQLGSARPLDGSGDGSADSDECDIGAYEADAPGPIPAGTIIVDTDRDTPIDSPDGLCTLREAIINADTGTQQRADCAAGSDGEDTIEIMAGLTITMTSDSSFREIWSSIIINGNGATVDGDSRAQIFRVNDTGELTINNLTLRNGLKTDDDISGGGAIRSVGQVTINDSAFIDNEATTGGAILFRPLRGSTTLSINNTTFSGNKATGNADHVAGMDIALGGAIHANIGGTIRINNSTFDRNTSNYNGGALGIGLLTHSSVIESTTLTITNSTFTNNSALTSGEITLDSGVAIPTGFGGAILIASGVGGQINADISGSSFSGNAAAAGGGAIALAELISASIINSTFSGNRAGAGGMAISIDDIDGDPTGSAYTFSHLTIANSIDSSGEAVAALSITDVLRPTLNNSILTDNAVADCAGTLAGNSAGNLIGSGCGGGDISGSARLRALSNGVHRLGDGSAAIDAVDCLPGIDVDQLGSTRPQDGDGNGKAQCDAGAYEAPSPTATRDATPTPRRRRVTAPATPTLTPTPTKPTGEILNETGYAVSASHGLWSGVQFKPVGGGGIGIDSVIESGFIDAIDVWGYVEQGVTVCFQPHQIGATIFLDAANAPRVVEDIASYATSDNRVCVDLTRPGTVVLVPGTPTRSALPAGVNSLQNCMVTLTAMLNFRDAPGGEVIGLLPPGVNLTALERTADWFKVDYHGMQGWVSASYVNAHGSCV